MCAHRVISTLEYFLKTLEDATGTNMDKKNVTFSRLVPCASSLLGNGPGCPPPALCRLCYGV